MRVELTTDQHEHAGQRMAKGDQIELPAKAAKHLIDTKAAKAVKTTSTAKAADKAEADDKE